MSVELILLLAGYLLAWQGYKVRHRVSGLGHIALILSLTATLANSTTARISAAHPHTLLTGQYIALVEHIFVVISVAGLYVFRLAVEGHTIHSRRVLATISGGALMSLGFAAITVFAIVSGELLSPTTKSYRDLHGFLYAFGAGIYYGSVMFAVALWMARYVKGREKHFRYGMRIAAAGLFIVSALSFVRAIPVASVFFGGPRNIVPHYLLGAVSAAAFPLVFVGLSYPLVISRLRAFRAWTRRRKMCADVRVVWKECVSAYPEIVLRPDSSPVRRLRDSIWNPAELSRLKTESFDGLAKLLVHSASTESAAAVTAAANLREAIRRYDEAHKVSVWDIISPTASEGDDEGVPPRPEGKAEDEMLLALADELRGMSEASRSRVSV